MNNLVIKVLVVLAWSVASIHATGNQPRVALGWGGGVGLYNPLTGDQIMRTNFATVDEHGLNNVPQYISFIEPNSNSLLVSFDHYNIWFYDASTGVTTESQPDTQSLGTACLLVKNNGEYEVVVPTRAGEIKRYNFTTGTVTRDFDYADHIGVSSLALFENNGNFYVVAGTTSGFIDIYDYESGTLIHSINAYQDGINNGSWINTVVVFKDGDTVKVVASTSVNPVPTQSGQIACWDLNTYEKIYCVDFAQRVNRDKFYNDGDTYAILLYKDIDGSLKMVVPGWDSEGVIKIWDAVTGQCVKKLYAEQFNDTTILPVKAFESNGVMKLIVGYYSGYLAVWNTQTGELEASVYQNENLPRNVSKIIRAISIFEVDGIKYCTVGNDNGDVYTWKLETLEQQVNWSVGQNCTISANACSQNLLEDPKKFQLGFFSLMMGCNVPVTEVNNFAAMSADNPHSSDFEVLISEAESAQPIPQIPPVPSGFCQIL